MEYFPDKKKDLANIINYNKNGITRSQANTVSDSATADIFSVLEFLQCVKYQKLFINMHHHLKRISHFEERWWWGNIKIVFIFPRENHLISIPYGR